MAGVSLHAVTKQWGETKGVDNQSLTIADKEFLVLLGPSGCGKTTTMRMIAGLEDPTSGDIYIGDRRVNDDLPKDRDIAMVFQNYGLYPHMSVEQNIAYPLRVRRVNRSEIVERVTKAAEQVELVALLKRKPKALSGGQRQRVALARAIVRTPKVFLMDEPLSNLDAKLRVSMRAELKNLSHRLKTTTVYVTHDQIEAMTLADRVAVMKSGKIQQIGPPDEIYNNPSNRFVASFIGSPSMNLVTGEIRQSVFVAVDGTSITLPDYIKTTQHHNAVLGVRPEDIAVVDSTKGDLSAQVFAVENTGDSVHVTVLIGGQKLIAKADRYFKCAIDDVIDLQLNRSHLYLFDHTSGERLR